jgi:hypothetical protein
LAAPFLLWLGVLLPEQRPRLLILHGFRTGPQLFGLPAGSGGTHLDSMMLVEHVRGLLKGVQRRKMHQMLQW